MSRYTVIDIDGHVNEPFEMWEKYLDPTFLELRPLLFGPRTALMQLPLPVASTCPPITASVCQERGSRAARSALVRCTSTATSTAIPAASSRRPD